MNVGDRQNLTQAGGVLCGCGIKPQLMLSTAFARGRAILPYEYNNPDPEENYGYKIEEMTSSKVYSNSVETVSEDIYIKWKWEKGRVHIEAASGSNSDGATFGVIEDEWHHQILVWHWPEGSSYPPEAHDTPWGGLNYGGPAGAPVATTLSATEKALDYSFYVAFPEGGYVSVEQHATWNLTDEFTFDDWSTYVKSLLDYIDVTDLPFGCFATASWRYADEQLISFGSYNFEADSAQSAANGMDDPISDKESEVNDAQAAESASRSNYDSKVTAFNVLEAQRQTLYQVLQTKIRKLRYYEHLVATTTEGTEAHTQAESGRVTALAERVAAQVAYNVFIYQGNPEPEEGDPIPPGPYYAAQREMEEAGYDLDQAKAGVYYRRLELLDMYDAQAILQKNADYASMNAAALNGAPNSDVVVIGIDTFSFQPQRFAGHNRLTVWPRIFDSYVSKVRYAHRVRTYRDYGDGTPCPFEVRWEEVTVGGNENPYDVEVTPFVEAMTLYDSGDVYRVLEEWSTDYVIECPDQANVYTCISSDRKNVPAFVYGPSTGDSRTKEGFSAYQGTEDEKPRIFRVETASGSFPGCTEDGRAPKTYSGSQYPGYSELSDDVPANRRSLTTSYFYYIPSHPELEFTDPGKIISPTVRQWRSQGTCGNNPIVDQMTMTLSEEQDINAFKAEVDAFVAAGGTHTALYSSEWSFCVIQYQAPDDTFYIKQRAEIGARVGNGTPTWFSTLYWIPAVIQSEWFPGEEGIGPNQLTVRHDKFHKNLTTGITAESTHDTTITFEEGDNRATKSGELSPVEPSAGYLTYFRNGRVANDDLLLGDPYLEEV